ncbi:hypothetical protein [Acaryochloris thomasi]|nr:hypothetical protein [Acaryochloris thomasi]
MTQLFAIFLALMLVVALPAQAESCRSVDGHHLCIVRLQRSAKHYWEYWAVVSVDGLRPAKVVFNCRDRIQIQADGTTVPFRPDGLGDSVCRLYRR